MKAQEIEAASAAQPQLSEDGAWWWNGTSWRPAAEGIVHLPEGQVTLVPLANLNATIQAVGARMRSVLAESGAASTDTGQIHEGVYIGQTVTVDTDALPEAVRSELERLNDRVRSLMDELNRRVEGFKSHGYDFLHEKGWLTASADWPVVSSLILKSGEKARLALPAVLYRHVTRTAYVGGSQGFSVPLGHGFRYRISGFAGQPVPHTSLQMVDAGTLTVTDQRLAFLGPTKSESIPLEKMLAVEVYADAVSVAREGRESPDVFGVTTPGRVAALLELLREEPEKVLT